MKEVHMANVRKLKLTEQGKNAQLNLQSIRALLERVPWVPGTHRIWDFNSCHPAMVAVAKSFGTPE